MKMPDVNLTRSQAFYFFLIIVAFPLQYFLVEWNHKSDLSLWSEHDAGILLKEIESTVRSYMSFTSWKDWLSRLLKATRWKNEHKVKTSGHKFLEGESVAKEVFLYRDPTGNFGSSIEPRSPRPNFIKYRVGQVIRHKQYGYRGVIVGWDKFCRAPQHWININHRGNMERRHQPSYSVLVDTRDRPDAQTTYVAEDNIEIIRSTTIEHPSVQDYFNFFDGVQYHMRPALKQIYPFD